MIIDSKQLLLTEHSHLISSYTEGCPNPRHQLPSLKRKKFACKRLEILTRNPTHLNPAAAAAECFSRREMPPIGNAGSAPIDTAGQEDGIDA